MKVVFLSLCLFPCAWSQEINAEMKVFGFPIYSLIQGDWHLSKVEIADGHRISDESNVNELKLKEEMIEGVLTGVVDGTVSKTDYMIDYKTNLIYFNSLLPRVYNIEESNVNRLILSFNRELTDKLRNFPKVKR